MNRISFHRHRLSFPWSPLRSGAWLPGSQSAVVLLACGLCLAAAGLQAGVVAWGDNSRGQLNVPPGLSSVVAVGAGSSHCLALQRDGSIVGWGDNTYGQASVPGGLTNAIMIAAGANNSFVLRSNGPLTGWGQNYYGSANVPAGLTNVVAIAGGGNVGLALRSDSTIVEWGAFGAPAGLSNVVAIAAGAGHVMALKTDGTVVSWGLFYAGNLPPDAPAGLSGVMAIAAGESHSLALKRDGTVVAWGSDAYGQCRVPAGLSGVVTIAAGRRHSLALKRDGSIASWGDNSYGQLNAPAGLANVSAIVANCGSSHNLALVSEGVPYWIEQPVSQTTYSGLPVQLRGTAAGAAPLTYQWRRNGSDIAGATDAILFLDNPQIGDSGSYSLIVSNSFGVATAQKATLTVVDSAPVLLAPMTNQTAYIGKSVSLQPSIVGSGPLIFRWQMNGVDLPGVTGAALALKQVMAGNAGQYTVRVSNPFGSITNAATLTVSAVVSWPGEIYPPGGLSDAVSIPGCGYYGAAVRRDGSVVAWDGKGWVELPPGLTNLIAVAGGAVHFVGLKADGTVLAWGDNSYGQTDVPPGLSGVVAVTAGLESSFAVKSDGTVIAWGLFYRHGGLGAPPMTFPVTPPPGLSNVVAIAAGDTHALALKGDGTVTAWGYNGYVPSDNSNIVAVAAAGYSSLCLRRDGSVLTLFGWDGRNPGSSLPDGLSNIVAIAAGVGLGIALRDDGTVVVGGDDGLIYPSPPGLTNVVGIFASPGSGGINALAGDLAPFLIRRPLNVTLGGDGSYTFRAQAVGSPPLRYQWQLNGTNLPGATASALPLRNVQLADAGNYTVFVTNAFGVTTSAAASLTVTGTPPVIVAQPQDQTVWRGGTAACTVSAVGYLPFTYQWQFNGTNLPAATGATLVLTNVQVADSGVYRVVVSNGFGSVTSSNATLAVLIPVGDALNTTGLVWTTSGDANWFGQPTVTHDGIDAAQSGRITANQRSILQTVMTGPGTVSFWWKVSSEQYWDTLEFSIGGVERARISGETSWQQQTFSLPSGDQTVQWIYAKDGGTSAGQDAGWLDQVTFTSGGGLLLLDSLSCHGNSFEVSLPTVSGKTYVLEYRNSLGDPSWIPLLTNAGNGATMVLSDTNATVPQRFYRIRQAD